MAVTGDLSQVGIMEGVKDSTHTAETEELAGVGGGEQAWETWMARREEEKKTGSCVC